MKSRDQNVGSVVRRRSDSRTVVDGSYDISDLELDDPVDEDEALDTHSPLAGEPGYYRPPPRILSRRSSEKDGSRITVAPPKPAVFTKYNKKKNKAVRIELDVSSGKISWTHPSSSSRKYLYLDDIREIRAGETARNYLAEFSLSDESLPRWFTVVYFDPERSKGRAVKFMHLTAPDANTCDQWVRALQHAMRTRDNMMSGMMVNDDRQWITLWHREMIKRFGTHDHSPEDERADFLTIRNICRNLSINKSERLLREQFETVTGGSSNASLDHQQYLEFFQRLTERRDLRAIFDRAIEVAPAPHNTPHMSISAFTSFISDCQKVDLSNNAALWLSTFNKFAGRRRGPDPVDDAFTSGITFEAFKDFMWSSANSPLKPASAEALLDRPLNEYFISSSHNTYLEGRQVRGESSAEMYIEVLKKGCRCIEIDCDNGSDGKPVVTHVMTATTRIPFLDCIKAVNQYAFYASDYPLILSLEVHCNAEQQKVMAEIMIEQFGRQLVRYPLRSGAYALPSPEELKRRILIKVKKPKEEEIPVLPMSASKSFAVPPEAIHTGHRRQRSLSAPTPRAIQQHLPKLVEQRLQPLVTPTLQSLTLCNDSSVATAAGYDVSASSTVPPTSSEDSDMEQNPELVPKKSKAKSNIVKELGELGVYTRGVKFSDWKSADSRSSNHVYSFNENTFNNKIKTPEGKMALEKHNTKCLMRVYPRGSRIYSSNFDPLQFWRRGVQMAATNWQTYDLGTQINDAMFAAGTDRTGYVLKPQELRRFFGSDSGGSMRKRKLEKQTVSFSVDIISAQYLEAPTDLRSDTDMNPYVELEVFRADDKDKDLKGSDQVSADPPARNGRAGAGSRVRKRTKIEAGNGFDPVFDEWGTETTNITLTTKYPSLVFLRWTVWNSPDGRNLSNNKEPMASFTAKLTSLEQGFRQLPLYNKRGELLHSKLFCRIQKKSQAPFEHDPIAEETVVEPSRGSEDSNRGDKQFFLRRVFSRTPSERRTKTPGASESGYFTRTTSIEPTSRHE